MVCDDDDAFDVVGDDVNNLPGPRGRKSVQLSSSRLRSRPGRRKGGKGGGVSVTLSCLHFGSIATSDMCQLLSSCSRALTSWYEALVLSLDAWSVPGARICRRSTIACSGMLIHVPWQHGDLILAERRVRLRTLVVVRPVKPAFPRQRSPAPSKNFAPPSRMPAMGRRNSPRTPLPVP